MATDYLGQVGQKVSETAGKTEHIESLAEAVKDWVASLDADLISLREQRIQIGNLMAPYRGLYRTLTASDLYDKVPDLAQIDILPFDPGMEALTDRIFTTAIAQAGNAVDKEIYMSILISALNKEGSTRLPWFNPAAVISSLLSRSDDWERVRRGVYRYLVEDLEELPW